MELSGRFYGTMGMCMILDSLVSDIVTKQYTTEAARKGGFLCYNNLMNTVDWTQIIVAIISCLGGIIGAFLAVRKGNRESEIKDAQREQRQSDRLDRIDEKISNLEHKVDIHNGYAEKFGDIAKQMTAMAKDIEYLKTK